MHLNFCTPFKPLDHPRASGDVTIAKDIHDFFVQAGHTVTPAPHLGTKYIWKSPAKWRKAYHTYRLAKKQIAGVDAWFTYHSYYKAPDILGPQMQKRGLPYIIFAPSHSPKRFKNIHTLPGALLNQKALFSADHLFVNKQRDALHLPDRISHDRISFIRPGIRPDNFTFDVFSRSQTRQQWMTEGARGIDDHPVILTVASMRAGVKAEGVEHVINTCAKLRSAGEQLTLVIAGSGSETGRLKEHAAQILGPDVHFTGFVDRWSLYRIYSAADIFAFPGINEGLGMVYLEAQSCGLPVVAWDHDGAPEVIQNNQTGIITRSWDIDQFAKAIRTLLVSAPYRRELGEAGAIHVRKHHDMYKNYTVMEKKIEQTVESFHQRQSNAQT